MQALLDAIARLTPTTEAQRVFHGRGGTYPGSEAWTLDAYPPLWVVTCHRPVEPIERQALTDALTDRWNEWATDEPLHWVLQTRHAGRVDTETMAGQVPDPHLVTQAGTRYLVHVLKGQNHGLFLDMAEGRRWVRQRVQAQPGARVLNLFAYTCAFSVVALQAGAGQVINVDMSQGALSVGQQNHRLNGVDVGARFLAHDVFSTWGKIGRAGPYDLVILDPPSHQKGSFVAAKDYPRLVRRLPELLAPGGHALLCLNAPELGPDFLHGLVAAQAPALVFQERLANPAVFADVSPERALKVLVYQAP
jgi:23S rRNA (cytosine1962-C5)-methyltransferase